METDTQDTSQPGGDRTAGQTPGVRDAENKNIFRVGRNCSIVGADLLPDQFLKYFISKQENKESGDCSQMSVTNALTVNIVTHDFFSA